MHKPNRHQSLLFDVTLCGFARGKIEITTALGGVRSRFSTQRRQTKQTETAESGGW